VKLVPLLLLAATLALTACDTVNTRRSFYRPNKVVAGHDYWHKQWEEAERPLDQAAKPGPESGWFGISHPRYDDPRALQY
jgi:hypothetical protein